MNQDIQIFDSENNKCRVIIKERSLVLFAKPLIFIVNDLLKRVTIERTDTFIKINATKDVDLFAEIELRKEQVKILLPIFQKFAVANDGGEN